jgi:tetratricopeptide (TPR) repeat protein
LRDQLLGRHHNDTVTTLSNLGCLLRDMGLFAEARPLLEEALAIRQTFYSLTHPSVAQSLQTLCTLFLYSGAGAEALPLLEQALSATESAYHPTHSEVAFPLTNLGYLHHRQGNWATALDYLQRALAIRLTQLGEHHHFTAVSLTYLGDLCTDMGEWATAADYLARARHSLTQTKLYARSLAQNSHANGRLRRATGDEAAARRYFREALAWREQHLGPEHPETLRSQQALDSLLAGQTTLSPNESNKAGVG